MIYEWNTKNTRIKDNWKPIKCKCGSTRLKANVAGDDDGDLRWLLLECKKCNKTLYYNGA